MVVSVTVPVFLLVTVVVVEPSGFLVVSVVVPEPPELDEPPPLLNCFTVKLAVTDTVVFPRPETTMFSL